MLRTANILKHLQSEFDKKNVSVHAGKLQYAAQNNRWWNRKPMIGLKAASDVCGSNIKAITGYRVKLTSKQKTKIRI